MKPSSQSPRTLSKLPESLNQRLNMYALAASAAGVSVLALAPPAEAKIVYTPAHVRLRVGHPPFPLDLNHDGVVDFYILHSASHNYGDFYLAACQHPKSYRGPFCLDTNRNTSSSNVIRATGSKGVDFEAALRYGAKIQVSDRFIKSGHERMASFCCYSGGSSASRWTGPWANGGKGVKNRYLGLKFKIKGQFHFGWARLTVKTTPPSRPPQNTFTAILTGYAYETIPGKAIAAGKTKGPDVVTVQPSTLGHLAAGASAIPAW